MTYVDCKQWNMGGGGISIFIAFLNSALGIRQRMFWQLVFPHILFIQNSFVTIHFTIINTLFIYLLIFLDIQVTPYKENKCTYISPISI